MESVAHETEYCHWLQRMMLLFALGMGGWKKHGIDGWLRWDEGCFVFGAAPTTSEESVRSQ